MGRPINPKSPQLTTEQRHAFARREIELRHAAETRVMREQKQQSELAAARARAVMREYIERQRREALEAGRAAHTQAQAEAQTSVEAEATAQRLIRTHAIRERALRRRRDDA